MRTVLIAASILLSANLVQADVIVEYQSDSSGANPALVPLTSASEVTADNLMAGSGLISASGSSWNWQSWGENFNFADAVADGSFWQWGFDVLGPFHAIDLTTLDLRVDRSSAASAIGGGPERFEVQASVNGGAAFSLLTHDFSGSAVGVDFLNVDLSALPQLTPGDSVVFTLGAFAPIGTNGAITGTFDLENIPGENFGLRVSGDVAATPEPGSFGLGVVAVGLLVLRRRRR